jgi:uncharacterized protein involved in exopolysaccharide biosynthesis
MVEQKRHDEARSPRERIARLRTVAARGKSYWRGSLAVLLLGGGIAFTVAVNVQRVYRSECTVFAKPRIRTDDRDDTSTSPLELSRQSGRLKDMLTTRARLEGAVRKFGLYPETTSTKTMLDAVEQMKPHVGFRALDGAQYVISFDGSDPQMVQNVTGYLADSLIGEFAAGDLSVLQREADFLGEEEQGALTGLEGATRALTLFLASHPEFALEAKQAAATPFGAFAPNPAAGIPLLPKSSADAATTDPELAALLRERSRLDGEARTAAAVARGLAPAYPPSARGASSRDASKRPLEDPIAQAQTELESAAKRVAETQADLASKSNLTEDHPDMRAARMAADAAARRLHEARVKLGALQQIAAPGARADLSQTPPELAEKLRQIDALIAARRARAASSAAPDSQSPAAPLAKTVVDLETEWQRLLRALNEAKSNHEALKLRTERAKLALEAARSQASERMAVIDPPYRPTHPSKGGRTQVAVGGLAMAYLLAIAYAALRVALDDTLFDAEDVEALGVVSVLGVVPHIASASRKELHRDPV